MSLLRFVLLDESNGATTIAGESMTPGALATIAAATQIQLNRDFSAEWGGNFTVRSGTGAGDIQPGEVVFALLPTLDTPDAVAYHDVNGNGVPTCFDAITLSETILGPGNSVSVAVSHELLETPGDEGCNVWCDDGQGGSVALEVADGVESNTYELNGVHVSDFLLRSFFVPGAKGPYNFMALAGLLGAIGPSKPFETAPGGYQIVRTMGAGEHQVTALYHGAIGGPRPGTRAYVRIEKRRHRSSRTFRRGVRG